MSVSNVLTKVTELIHKYPILLLLHGNPADPYGEKSEKIVHDLVTHGVRFNYLDVNKFNDEMREGFLKFTNTKEFPMLFIDGQFEGGYEEVLKKIENNELFHKIRQKVPDNLDDTTFSTALVQHTVLHTRLLDGKIIKLSFNPASTIGEVRRRLVENEKLDEKSFIMACPRPKQLLGKETEDKTLRELELEPSAVICLGDAKEYPESQTEGIIKTT